jgi:hypothetical protein
MVAIFIHILHLFQPIFYSVADPDPGSGTFLTTGSKIRDDKKNQSQDPDSGMNIPHLNYENLL